MTSLDARVPIGLLSRLRATAGRLLPVGVRVRLVGALVVAGLLALVGYTLAGTTFVEPYPDGFAPSWVAILRDAFPWLTGGFSGVLLVGTVLSVVALPVALFRPLLATTLAAVPFVAVPLYGTFVFGWWWSLAGVAVVAALTRVRDAVPAFVLAVGVVAGWNATLIMMVLARGGLASFTGGMAGWWTVLGFAAYLAAAIAVSATVGSSLRYGVRLTAVRIAQRDVTTAASVTAERARLARDLHDVVAHHVSLVAVRAESAPYVHPDLGDDARAVLRDIAADARSALSELRQVLKVLERSDPAPHAPQPRADDVGALVDEARAAGQHVELSGAWSEVPASHGYVLYRAVQEGLTNARRHAPGAGAALNLQQRGGVVGFTLTNRSEHAVVEEGSGLAGMRERVESLGGAMETTAGDGRFSLVVMLPAEPTR